MRTEPKTFDLTDISEPELRRLQREFNADRKDYPNTTPETFREYAEARLKPSTEPIWTIPVPTPESKAWGSDGKEIDLQGGHFCVDGEWCIICDGQPDIDPVNTLLANEREFHPSMSAFIGSVTLREVVVTALAVGMFAIAWGIS